MRRLLKLAAESLADESEVDHTIRSISRAISSLKMNGAIVDPELHAISELRRSGRLQRYFIELRESCIAKGCEEFTQKHATKWVEPHNCYNNQQWLYRLKKAGLLTNVRKEGKVCFMKFTPIASNVAVVFGQMMQDGLTTHGKTGEAELCWEI